MYALALLRIISRIVKSETEAEDVLQETFVKIWKSIAEYNPSRGRLFTWIAASARDHFRSRAQINANKNSDIDEFSNDLETSFRDSYSLDAIGLRNLTFGLHSSQKEVLDLIYFYGYTNSEAAEELGVSLGTSKTRLRRALLTLGG